MNPSSSKSNTDSTTIPTSSSNSISFGSSPSSSNSIGPSNSSTLSIGSSPSKSPLQSSNVPTMNGSGTSTPLLSSIPPIISGTDSPSMIIVPTQSSSQFHHRSTTQSTTQRKVESKSNTPHHHHQQSNSKSRSSTPRHSHSHSHHQSNKIEVSSKNGGVLFTAFLPNGVSESQVEVQQVGKGQLKGGNEKKVVSSVIELKVRGSISLKQPVKLCFEVKGGENRLFPPSPPPTHKTSNGCQTEKKTRPCLSQLNENKNFECVDNNLNVTSSSTNNNNKKMTTTVCGMTPHLSTFAILLSSSETTKCSTSPLFWAAIGCLGGMCLICLIALAIGEKIRYDRNKKLDKTLRQMQQKMR